MKITEILNYLKSGQNKIESILLSLIITSYTLNKYIEKSIDFLLVISIGLLSVFYFFIAQIKEEGDDAISIFKRKISYLGFSLGILGVLFKIQEYPGSSNMLIVGIGTVFISILLNVLINFKVLKSNAVKNGEIIRGILFFVIFLTFYILS